MLPEPLHPAVVHFPIALAFLMPAAAAWAFMAIRRGGSSRPAWIPVAALAAILFASAWVSVNTGEAQDEVVEAVVPDAPLHEHEEAAEVFLIASGLLLGIAGVGLARGSVGRIARGATIVTSLVVLFLGYRVGRAGGELVYTHGAAQAWTDGTVTGGPTGSGESGVEADDDDDGEAARSPRR